jgi:hypothetical protein
MGKLQQRNISVRFRISTAHIRDIKNLAQEVILLTGICRFLARISVKKLIIVSVSALGECMDVSVYFVIILDSCLLETEHVLVCSFRKKYQQQRAAFVRQVEKP